MRALGKLLMILGAAGVGSIAGTAEAGMPKNMIFFVPGGVCPQGSSRAADANGRMLLVANDPGAVGRTYETALRDKEDRKNHAVAHVSVNLNEHRIAGASSCCNTQATNKGTHSATFDTGDATSNLPFVQLLACKVD
ncbi:MAG TPA: hypothetical protein VLX44_20200 [Xanthobacteraceae bacterium]|nr:hypothetical protein [Xanthobacteraceae bacterium]